MPVTQNQYSDSCNFINPILSAKTDIVSPSQIKGKK